MGAQQNRAAGKDFERRCEEFLQAEGWYAMRRFMSGAHKDLKGDITFSTPTQDMNFLAECKKSRGDSIAITGAWLRKIEAEADAIQRFNCLLFGTNGSPIYIAMPLKQFIALIDGFREVLDGQTQEETAKDSGSQGANTPATSQIQTRPEAPQDPNSRTRPI